jgi:hypothetical protein
MQCVCVWCVCRPAKSRCIALPLSRNAARFGPRRLQRRHSIYAPPTTMHTRRRRPLGNTVTRTRADAMHVNGR